MTQEEKKLLLKDLAARLPYGVKMRYKDDPGYEVLCQIDTFYTDVDGFRCLLRTTGPYGAFQDLNELKPYLRPMSSMTKEEFKEYHNMLVDIDNSGLMNQKLITKIVDWLDEKKFDHRKLIPKRLALEAPEGMYEIE